jgi:predicted nucleic acid-binding Zn ribbon protein
MKRLGNMANGDILATCSIMEAQLLEIVEGISAATPLIPPPVIVPRTIPEAMRARKAAVAPKPAAPKTSAGKGPAAKACEICGKAIENPKGGRKVCSKECLKAKGRLAWHAKRKTLQKFYRATPADSRLPPRASRSAPPASRLPPSDSDRLTKIREINERIRARNEMEKPDPTEA